MSIFQDRVNAFKRLVISETVRKHKYDRMKAAAELGISLRTICTFIGQKKVPEPSQEQKRA